MGERGMGASEGRVMFTKPLRLRENNARALAKARVCLCGVIQLRAFLLPGRDNTNSHARNQAHSTATALTSRIIAESITLEGALAG